MFANANKAMSNTKESVRLVQKTANIIADSIFADAHKVQFMIIKVTLVNLLVVLTKGSMDLNANAKMGTCGSKENVINVHLSHIIKTKSVYAIGD